MWLHACIYALMQDRDYSTPRTESEAFTFASSLDAGFSYGPGLMARYTRTPAAPPGETRSDS